MTLDACVLYPAPLRDLLLELAASGLFRAKWTDAIHEEWIRALLANRTDLSRERLMRTRALMDAAVPDCLVQGYEGLIDGLVLPDEDDRHVLAAAIHSHSDAVVTFNASHFPKDVVAIHDLEILHPDAFVHHQFGLSMATVLTAAKACRTRLRNPPVSAERYLRILQSQALLRTAAELAPFAAII